MDIEDPKVSDKERGPGLDDDPRFKALRHRFWRLAKHGPQVLTEMGYSWPIPPSQETCRKMLFEIAEKGRLDKLESVIKRKEAEILEQIGHKGDPCEFCSLAWDQVKPGPCPVRKKQVQP